MEPERVASGASPISVPTVLRGPHRLVVTTRDAFSRVKPDETGRLRIPARAGVAYLHVSRDQLRRALLILQAIFGEAEHRDWAIKPDQGGYGDKDGVGIRLRGHTYTVSIREMTDRIPLTEPRSSAGTATTSGAFPGRQRRRTATSQTAASSSRCPHATTVPAAIGPRAHVATSRPS